MYKKSERYLRPVFPHCNSHNWFRLALSPDPAGFMSRFNEHRISTVPLWFRSFFAAVVLLFFFFDGRAQKPSNEEIRRMVSSFKKDPRGPYQDIRWFCADGTTVGQQEKCPEPGGVLHARPRESVTNLANTSHVFLGQILTGTIPADFWDADHNHSQLKQYQLEKYLRETDDGWIMRKARDYRDVIQPDDEEAWGGGFYKWLLAMPEVNAHFYLVRQSLRDIPHPGGEDRAAPIREQSRVIARQVPAFAGLNSKLYRQPEPSDIQRVMRFRSENSANLNATQNELFDGLISTMQAFYQPLSLDSLAPYLEALPEDAEIRGAIAQYIQRFSRKHPTRVKIMLTASLMWRMRTAFAAQKDPDARLALLELSLRFEEILLRDVAELPANDMQELMRKIHSLALACVATGQVESWEWKYLRDRLKVPQADAITMDALHDYYAAARSVVEWSADMHKAVYGDVVALYSGFEPLANGYTDHLIRNSTASLLAQAVEQMGKVVMEGGALQNDAFETGNQVMGLNPGYAVGELVVVNDSAKLPVISENKIYAFKYAPAETKAAAGVIITGDRSLVSPLHLMAREQGIPSATVSETAFNTLSAYHGKRIFYAVSLHGAVVMKLESEMTMEEKGLFAATNIGNRKVTVALQDLQLEQREIMNLRTLKASDYGRVCGPVAANLGQMKARIPNRVTEGLVIPFGIFKQHMDQPMPGQEKSYWEYLNTVFKTGEEMRGYGMSEAEVDAYERKELEVLHKAVADMSMLPSFTIDLQLAFEAVFNTRMGRIPLSLYSETNLAPNTNPANLSVQNIISAEAILQGIRDTWAAIYKESHYDSCQRHLIYPELVFPSVLIVPTLDADYSGKFIYEGDRILTFFHRGSNGYGHRPGSERHLLLPDGRDVLMSPAREPFYHRLPAAGGMEQQIATFNEAILSDSNITVIRSLSESVHQTLLADPKSSYIVEMGFRNNDGRIFQVIPFSESKEAFDLNYLDFGKTGQNREKLIMLETRF